VSFLGELKRRKVFQVAAVYGVTAWLLVQIAATIETPLSLPDWFDTFVIVLVILGFPIAVIMSWSFELTPQGLVRDEGGTRAVRARGRTLEYVLLGLLVVAVGWVLYRVELDDGRPREVLENSIAVLPCASFSTDAENEYFALGLHEELLNRLVNLRNLDVIARTSVMQYANTTRPITEIADELGVRSVMECSVAYGDGRVVISAQLIDGDTGVHLWSERYNREFRDIFGIQADIAMNVANQLQAELSADEQETLEKPPTDSPEAYALYMKGRNFWNQRSEALMESALRAFEQAIEFDPEYALAQVGIADVWIFRGWYSVLPPNEVFPKAKDAIEKALAIDPSLAAVHTSRGHIYLEYDHDWAAAEKEYLRGIELDPRYAIGHHWYGGYLSAMGRHAEGLEQALLARELEPVSLIINTWVGLRHYFAGRYAVAVGEYEHALNLDPNFAPAHWHLGWALEQLGEFDAAIASAERAVAISKNPIYLASLGHAQAMAGNEQEARRILAELDQIGTTQHVSAYHVAVIYAALGDTDNAFLWLERAYAERAPWIGYLRVDPRLDPLRADSRFASVLRQARLDF
jgi:TolB-like protein/Tfp pilus assembly protein PilF